jgi:signal transduction histidine kinase
MNGFSHALLGAGGLVAGATLATARHRRALADLDHAVRTPLTVIHGEVELVLSQHDSSDDQRRRSCANTASAATQIQRLLAQARSPRRRQATDPVTS